MHLKPWGFRLKHCGPERWPDPRLSGIYGGREIAWKETQSLLFKSTVTLLSATILLLSPVHLPVLPSARGWQRWDPLHQHVPGVVTSPSQVSTAFICGTRLIIYNLWVPEDVWLEFLVCFAFFFSWWMNSSLCCNYGRQLNIYSLALPRQTCIISALIRAYMCMVCGIMGSWSTWEFQWAAATWMIISTAGIWGSEKIHVFESSVFMLLLYRE